MILLFLTRARQRASSCFSPELKLAPVMTIQSVMGMIYYSPYEPSSPTVESRLNFASATGSGGPLLGRSQARWRTEINSASVRRPCGSLNYWIREDDFYMNSLTHRFSRRVPRNKVPSCGTNASRVRKTSRPISRMFRPSISIFPPRSSTVLKYRQ